VRDAGGVVAISQADGSTSWAFGKLGMRATLGDSPGTFKLQRRREGDVADAAGGVRFSVDLKKLGAVVVPLNVETHYDRPDDGPTRAIAAAATAAVSARVTAVAELRAHDDTIPADAHWKLDGSLAEEINGTNTLTGTGKYGYVHGLLGARFPASASPLVGVANDPNLICTGDLTVEFLVLPAAPLTANQRVVQEAGTATLDTEPTNLLWAVDFTGSNVGDLSYNAEQGLGVNIGPYSVGYGPPVGVVSHVAMVRTANQVQFYLNGRAVGAPSVGLLQPTAGAPPLQRFEVGGATGLSQPFWGWIASVKIVKSALSAAQVLREAEYCLFGGA
jgi:hypothetical protein